MKIINFNKQYIDEVVSLWNKSCKEEMPYKPFTREEFIDKFCSNTNYDNEGTFLAIEDNHVIGFANGVCKRELGYLTFVLVDKDYRNKGYGSLLLSSVESYFKNNNKKSIDIIFFNPINLEWFIPATDKHDHPNSPGVDIESKAYEFLQNRNYKVRSIEMSMYLSLDKFNLPQRIISKEKELKNISIEYYNKEKHTGFKELFDNLKNEDWRKLINDNLELDKPYPILIASDEGKICGFSGPIKVQQSGRGWFAGIGVDPNYQGLGIGTCLFYKLCERFKLEGASFMSLFTGEKNKARNIYEGAGFKVVKKWAVMRKGLN